jgi:hypothetical protein
LRDIKKNEIESINENKAIEYKIKKEQITDTLSITVDFPWSGCAKMDGDITFKGDSLLLMYMLKEKTLCSEIVYYRLNYRINNPQKKSYHISVQYLEK